MDESQHDPTYPNTIHTKYHKHKIVYTARDPRASAMKFEYVLESMWFNTN